MECRPINLIPAATFSVEGGSRIMECRPINLIPAATFSVDGGSRIMERRPINPKVSVKPTVLVLSNGFNLKLIKKFNHWPNTIL